MNNNIFQIEKDYFPSVIGQEEVKRRLAFYLDSYKETQIFPNTLFISPKGCGKTLFSVELGKLLNKPTLVINSASIKSATSFVEQIVIPHVQGNKVCLFFDECHEITNSKGLMTFLLSAMNVTKSGINQVNFQDYVLDFDLRKVTFILATTDFHKLSYPLRDRCVEFHLKPYKPTELIQILKINSPNVVYADNVEMEIVDVCRGAPRQCVRFACDIVKYTIIHKNNVFGKNHWEDFKQKMGILPFGLNDTELTYLKLLFERGKLTLTGISALLELSTTTVRTGIENFLLKQNLIKIEPNGRYITSKGIEILKTLKK